MKLKKKIVIPIAIVAAAAVAGGAVVSANSGKVTVPVVSTYTLSATDLTNAVSVTGTVESEESTNVYSTLSYPVKVVNVEVGDTVTEGDILCELDTRELESTIAQNQASLSALQAKANYNLAIAQKDLETHSFNVDGDYNTELLSAEGQVQSAELGIQSASVGVTTARQNIRDLRDEGYSDSEMTAARDALARAEVELELAQTTLEQAQSNYRAIQMKVKEDAVNAQDGVKLAELDNNFQEQYLALQKLRSDLGEAEIIAPVSGTVTAVMATEGDNGSGLLFVIEDLDSLIVTVNIKEYDIGSVKEGLPVTIKSDGTGDEQYEGKVDKIAPTTVKSTDTTKSNDPEFETKIRITSKSDLRVGMNARLNILTEEKSGILAVPYEAIATNEAGEEIVYVVRPSEDGATIARAVVIETGMETDFYTEISSPDLQDGDLVITDPDGMVDGMQVSTMEGAPQGAVLA